MIFARRKMFTDELYIYLWWICLFGHCGHLHILSTRTGSYIFQHVHILLHYYFFFFLGLARNDEFQ